MIQHLALIVRFISNLMPPMSLLSPALAGRFHTTSTTWKKSNYSQQHILTNALAVLSPSSHPFHQQPPLPTPGGDQRDAQWPVRALLNSQAGRLQLALPYCLAIELVDTSDLWLFLSFRNIHLLYRNVLAFLFFIKKRLIKIRFTYFLQILQRCYLIFVSIEQTYIKSS